MRNLFRLLPISLVPLLLSGCGIIDDSAADGLIKRLNAEASVRNAKVKIAFDPEREAILTSSAPYLVMGYRLNVAYRDRDEDDKNRRGQHYDSFRAVHYPNCNRPQADTDWNYSLDGYEHPGVCRLHIFDDAPPPSALTTHAKWHTVEIEGHAVRQMHLTIRRPDGRSAVLLFYPGRSDLEWETAPLIASALGLQPRGKGHADLPGPKQVDRLVTLVNAKAQGAEARWLDQRISGQLAWDDRIAAQQFAPAEIAMHAEALTQQFERRASQPDNTGAWDVIGKLLARLPQSDWVRFRARVAAAMLRAPRDRAAPRLELIHRMTDMGVAAGPVLAHAYSDGRYRDEIAIAVCRIGAPAAPHLGKAMLTSWKAANVPYLKTFDGRRRWSNRGFGSVSREQRRRKWEECTAHGRKYGPPENIAFSACWAKPKGTPDASPTYLALRRMGLGEQADAMMWHKYSDHWKKTYASVGPGSPAKLCGESKEL